MKKALICFATSTLSVVSLAIAQQPGAQSALTVESGDHMDQKTTTVTRMAELCERMMQNKMTAKS